MKIISKTGSPKFAEVYVAQVRDDPRALIEFVDAVDPRYPREQKRVIIVSTQIGCPIGCLMCDSGAFFLGDLTKEEMFAEIDHVLKGDLRDHPKLKIQFARMGEPALNMAVLDVLEELPKRYPIKGIMPCIATTAPAGSEGWFVRLTKIKDRYYNDGRFQLQFSINSTDENERNIMIPTKKWQLSDIADYGRKFYKRGDRKVTLNFALSDGGAISAELLRKYFNPAKFLVKITPVNPTDGARRNRLNGVVSPHNIHGADRVAKELGYYGFETIISIGTPEEIAIGSNCGQSVKRMS